MPIFWVRLVLTCVGRPGCRAGVRFRPWISGLGFWASTLGFRVPALGCKHLGFRAWDLGFKV